MAEMTAREAIAVLHNNQYQKHIANGEYDYIHPLTDAECKGIESLIQQQAQTIEAMKCCGNCEHFETVCGEGKCFVDCDKPAWRFDKKVKYADGTGKCDKWQVKKEASNDV